MFSPLEELCLENDLVLFEMVEEIKNGKKTLTFLVTTRPQQRLWLLREQLLEQSQIYLQ